MGNYEQLKEAIKAVIKTNGKQEITGQVMQDTLLAITSSFGQGALFAGIATPEINPLTPDQNVFYLASQSGVYPNFNGLTVNEGEIAVFSLSAGQWTKQILSLGGGGSVTIINEPDEEDLTTVPQSAEKNVIRFKNRIYDEANASGKGYKILRKYWKTIDGVRKNILTQDMINDANTIYEIRYDFDLNGAEIQIKEGCVLNFVGGSLKNGKLIFLNTLLNDNIKIECLCSGKIINNDCDISWFCPKADGISDDTNAFQSAINICDVINIPKGTYTVCLQKRKYDETPNGIYINRSNVHLRMDKESVIKGKVPKEVAKPSNGYTGYSTYFGHVIVVKSSNEKEFINNITIEGGTLIGVREEFAEPIGSGTEENQCGLRIEYTNNCIIKDCVIKDNQGDAIIVYNSINVSIINTTCINSRRTGISIGPCKNFLIESCKFINNGCDTLYNGNIKYATGPQAGICLEGDTYSTIVDGKFNNVIIQNCYCEYDSYLTPPSSYVFVARNPPVFVLIGYLKNGADKIVVRDCKIKNIQSAKSSSFTVSSRNTKCKNLYFLKNTYQSLVDGKSNASMFLLVSSDIDNVLINQNICTTNTRMVFLYEGDGKFGDILVHDNMTLEAEGNQFALCDSFNGKTNRLTISNNYSSSIISGSLALKEIDECNIRNNYNESSGIKNGDALVNINAPRTAVFRFMNNICKFTVSLNNTFYIFKIRSVYLDDNNDVVDETVATKISGPRLEFINNNVNIKGSKNVFFSSSPNYISGIISNNTIKTSDLVSLSYEAPRKPLADDLYIHNNIFDNKGNTYNSNIIKEHIKNVYNYSNIYLGRKVFGETLDKPKFLNIEDTGYLYYDKSLGYPIWWNGSKWINSSSGTAYLNKGITSERPTLTNADDGFEYYDTTLMKKILWNGIAWVNVDGTALQ